MRVITLKKIHILLLTAVLAITIGLLSGPSVYACSSTTPCLPYFKVMGSDVFTGGWYTTSGVCNTTIKASPYQDYYYRSFYPDGGIMTSAKVDTSGNSVAGSSAEYGAFALGNIVSSGGTSPGFYSGASQKAAGAATAKDYTTFANSSPQITGLTTGSWGGLFQGTTRQSHCIPDYYGAATGTPMPGPLDSTTAQGTYLQSPAAGTVFTLNNAPVVITGNKQITVYVHGSVYISSNITYDRSTETVDQVPQFALVAQGAIYIAPGVTQLDGLYVAQPAPADTSFNSLPGTIWTCHNASNSVPMASWAFTNCFNRLVVNGALVGKQVIPLRLVGDMNVASATEDRDCRAAIAKQDFVTANTVCANIAEIINFPAERVIAENSSSTSSSSTSTPTSYTVDSLINLPPVF